MFIIGLCDFFNVKNDELC